MLQIGIGCSSDREPLAEAAVKARAFAVTLSKYKDDVILLSGGDGGLMRTVCEEFVKRGGMTLGIIPFEDEAIDAQHPRYNPFNTIVFRSGQTYQARSIGLVRSSDAFVVLGGGSGTIIEAHLAYIYRVPLIILTGTGYATDILQRMHPDGHLDHRRAEAAHFTADPQEAAELAYSMSRRRSDTR